MSYSEELTREMQADASTLNGDLSMLWARLASVVAGRFKSPPASEYLLNGVCRRLDIVRRCMVRIFNTSSVDRKNPLDDKERFDVEIALQCFMLNVYGILDNVAWVFLFERNAAPKRRQEVSLFSAKIGEHLPASLRDALDNPDIRSWHEKYVKPYRDALAHRIPLYVPPMGLDKTAEARSGELDEQILSAIKSRDIDSVETLQKEQEGLGVALPAFVQSHWDEDAPPPMWLHPQVIVDAKTVLSILNAAFP